jgi:hypothetical protein
MQYAPIVDNSEDGTHEMVPMSYQRKLFCLAQLSTIILSVHSWEHEANIRTSHELSFVGIFLPDSGVGAHSGTSRFL